MDRLTETRKGKYVIPLRNVVCGIDMPHWSIEEHRPIQSFLSGDAADKLAAYEDAEEQGLLVRLPCKVGDTVWFYLYEDRGYIRKGVYQGIITELKAVQRLNRDAPLFLAFVRFEYSDPWYSFKQLSTSEMHCSFGEYGSWVQFYLTREEAETAMRKGGVET